MFAAVCSPPEAAHMILPFPDHPPVHAYLHHAYTTGIIQACGYEKALMNHYLSLELRVDDAYSGVRFFLDFTPWTDLSAFEQAGLCALKTYSAESIAGASAADLADVIRTALSKRKYIEAYVDEYYIPTTAAFGKKHTNHALLTVGFEGSAGKFKVVLYKKGGRFDACYISPGALCEAIFMQPRLNAPYTADKAMREVEVFPGHDVVIDPVRISDGLAQFLSPQKGLKFQDELFSGRGPRSKGFIYGIECYEYIRHELRRGHSERSELDVRLTRLAWERVRLGLVRLQYLRETFPSLQVLVQRWEQLTKEFRRVHLIAYQFNLDLARNRVRQRTDPESVLERAVGCERELTAELVELIRRG